MKKKWKMGSCIAALPLLLSACAAQEADAVSVIGGADGPTAIFVAGEPGFGAAIVAVLLVVAGLALLYVSGLLPVSVKHSAVFVGHGSWKRKTIGASFTRCSGKIFRVLRVREGRSFSFHLSGHVQQGNVRVTLTRRGETLLELTRQSPSGVVSLETGQVYRLTVCFQDASGDYQLDWS